MDTSDKIVVGGLLAAGVGLAAGLFWRDRKAARLTAELGGVARRRKNRVPDTMIQTIAEKNEQGKTPKMGWYSWLLGRYTPEAVSEFLDLWQETTCNVSVVKKVKSALGM